MDDQFVRFMATLGTIARLKQHQHDVCSFLILLSKCFSGSGRHNAVYTLHRPSGWEGIFRSYSLLCIVPASPNRRRSSSGHHGTFVSSHWSFQNVLQMSRATSIVENIFLHWNRPTSTGITWLLLQPLKQFVCLPPLKMEFLGRSPSYHTHWQLALAAY